MDAKIRRNEIKKLVEELDEFSFLLTGVVPIVKIRFEGFFGFFVKLTKNSFFSCY